MVQDVRGLNRSEVLAALMMHRPATRKQIAEVAGLSPATVTRVVEQLAADGVVREVEEVVVDSPGRRAILLDMVAEMTVAIGVDVGASNTRLIATDLLATPLASMQVPTPTNVNSEQLAKWVAERARELVGPRWDHVAAVAIGLPGAVNVLDQTVSNAPNLPQIEDTSFLKTCEGAMGVSFTADNDANLALMGEMRFGAARMSREAAHLSLGAGLGAGVAIGGVIHRGRHGLVGEFGQIPIGSSGRRLEDSTTGPGIMRRAADSGVDIDSPADIFSIHATPAEQVLRAEFDMALVTTLAAIAVACEPEIVVLGGGIMKSLPVDLSYYQNQLENVLRLAPSLVHAELGDFSGAAGGVVSALRMAYEHLGIPVSALSELPRSENLTLEKIQAVLSPVHHHL